DGPYHSLESIHSREVRGVEIFVDVFKVHAPGISAFLEKALNLGLDPSLIRDVRAVLQILNLLLELRTAAGFRFQPGFGNIGDRHTRLVKRIQKPAIATAVGRNIASRQHLQRTLLSAAFVARSTRTDRGRFDCSSKDNAGRAAAAPSKVASFQ